MGEIKFQPREFPWSGSKAEDIKEKEEERAKVNDYNGQYLSPEPINSWRRKIFKQMVNDHALENKVLSYMEIIKGKLSIS